MGNTSKNKIEDEKKMVDIFVVLLPGLIIGIIFGFILQRGRFCMNSAFRDILVLKEFSLIKAVVLAILVSMLGFAIMSFAGIITLNPKGFAPIANIVGGFIFGLGMTLAAGCASGTTYRVGEGMMGSLVALLGYSIGAYVTKSGAWAEAKTFLQTFKISEVGTGANLTVFGSALTPIFMLIIGIAGIAVVLYFWVLPMLKARKTSDSKMFDFSDMSKKIFKTAWPWSITGLAIGILACFAYISSAATGRNYPLGITGGWSNWLKYWTTGADSALSWEVFLVLGVILGAFISSMIAGEFKFRAPKDGKRILIQFIGGLTMGFGAVVAMGCNIGNTLSGVPLLSVGSLVSTAFIILGCWFLAYFLFMRK